MFYSSCHLGYISISAFIVSVLILSNLVLLYHGRVKLLVA